MLSLFDYAILSFASLFVIVDPIGLIPVFLAMTENNTVKERVRMAKLAAVITFAILMLSMFGGSQIFNAFGITLPALEIAGGIILLLIALDMLQARRTAVKETQEEKKEAIQKDDVAVTPLAIPMLAGPGAITTVILLSHRAHTIYDQAVLIGNILIVSLLTFIILWIAAVRSAHLSAIALKITARLMGLLLSAIAVQFILNGISAVIR
ncbi:MAG: NAAT family transporter [Candidatus Omnitrophica bacterium]|nr:NAAT family transporter [Candidatus Omnitrophota bacterium]MDD5670686.1 NAAT family transporter [Candidatus Omnitrophota bacterium]